jgi:hypothetical protein
METKKKFLKRVKTEIERCWKKTPKDHKTLKSAIVWVSCYFQARKFNETKDIAQLFISGLPRTITIRDAMRYWSEVYYYTADNISYFDQTFELDGQIKDITNFWFGKKKPKPSKNVPKKVMLFGNIVGQLSDNSQETNK